MLTEQMVRAYIESLTKPESQGMVEIRRAITEQGAEHEEIFPSQAAILEMFIVARNANRVLELGTAYGYSGAAIVAALHKNGGGKFISVELDSRRADYSRSTLSKLSATVSVDVIEGNDNSICQKLIDEGQKFDLIFVDSSEANYLSLYDGCTSLLTDRGVLIYDNVLMLTVKGWTNGSNVIENSSDPVLRTLSELVTRALSDDRMATAIFGSGSGLLVCAKRLAH